MIQQARPLRTRLLFLPICLCVLGLTVSCANQIYNGLTEMAKSFPFDLLMQPQDLPAGWFVVGGSAPDITGGKSRVVSLRVSRDDRFTLARLEAALKRLDDRLASQK